MACIGRTRWAPARFIRVARDFRLPLPYTLRNTTDLAVGALSAPLQQVGLSAATFFSQKLESEPGSFMKVMQIRSEIQAGKNNAAMMLIMECFNVDGMHAMQALESMKKLG